MRASRDLLRTSMDAIDSAVSVPLAASRLVRPTPAPPALSIRPTTRRRRSYRPPSDTEADDADIDPEHAATWALVRAAQQGDGEAFAQLYDRYVDTIHRYVYYRVGSARSPRT